MHLCITLIPRRSFLFHNFTWVCGDRSIKKIVKISSLGDKSYANIFLNASKMRYLLHRSTFKWMNPDVCTGAWRSIFLNLWIDMNSIWTSIAFYWNVQTLHRSPWGAITAHFPFRIILISKGCSSSWVDFLVLKKTMQSFTLPSKSNPVRIYVGAFELHYHILLAKKIKSDVLRFYQVWIWLHS